MFRSRAFSILAACSWLPLLVATTPTTFKLIAFPTTDVLPQVFVNGYVVELTPPDPNAPYYTTMVELDSGFTYKYVVDGVAEPFDRILTDIYRPSTHNDFYGRARTVQKLLNLPWPFKDQWQRSFGLTPLFDDSYIPTIHLSGDPAVINDMFVNMEKIVNVTMTVYTADYELKYEDVRYGISAVGRKNNYAKQAYQLRLKSGDKLFERDQWKLRNTEEDPTQLREKTYMQLLNAAGCPVIQGNNVRLYINKTPIGTYIINDNGDQRSFIKAMFHGQQETKIRRGVPTGTLIQGDFLDFVYKGDDPTAYSGVKVTEIGNNPVTNPLQSLIALVKALYATGADDASVDAFGKLFDIETFLRAMALEYLTVHWDGYWEMGTNFLLYEDPVTNKWYFIDQDFDQTMGVSASAAYATAGRTLTSMSYKQYGGSVKGSPRPILDKILAAPKYAARFEQIIKAIVQHTFNPIALGARFEANHARIRDDVQWDRSQPRRHTGRPDNWVIADFDTNLNNPVKHAEWGLTQWVAERSAAVAKEFNFQIDSVLQPTPDPITAPPNVLQSSGLMLIPLSAAGYTALVVVILSASMF